MKVSRENPWYWELGDKPVLLLGGCDVDNLFNRVDSVEGALAALTACGGNFIRMALSSRDGRAQPFDRTVDGFDLYRPNREYWERLYDCCAAARARGVVLQIDIWAAGDFYQDAWQKNPFNPAGNLNYSTDDSTLPSSWPHGPSRGPQPFFRTVPALGNDEKVLSFQRAFVDKALETMLRFENVLYSVDSDGHAPREWSHFWGEYVNREAARRGYTVSLTESSDDADLRSPQYAAVCGRPDIFSFVDVSANNRRSGAEHWNTLLEMRRRLADSDAGPRPLSNAAVSGRGESGQCDVSAAFERFWQDIFAGSAAVHFAPQSSEDLGIGLSENARTAIAAARSFLGAFDVFSAEPASQLLSDVPAAGACASAREGRAYAVYLSEGGRVTLDLTGCARQMTLRWFDPRKRGFRPPRPVMGGRYLSLCAPDDDLEWLALVAAV